MALAPLSAYHPAGSRPVGCFVISPDVNPEYPLPEGEGYYSGIYEDARSLSVSRSSSIGYSLAARELLLVGDISNFILGFICRAAISDLRFGQPCIPTSA